MDLTSSSLYSNPNDGFSDSSGSDDEEEAASRTDSAAWSAGIVETTEDAGTHTRSSFQSNTWHTGDSIKRVPHIWSAIIDAFCRTLPQKPTILAHSLEESLESNEDEYRVKSVISATFRGQIREMLLSSWMNTLLVFVLAGVGTYVAKASPLLVFTCNAIAIVPLSALLTDATERIAAKAGDTIGALLNISFGNLVELILFIALANDQIYIVQASILGSILVNLLLILGTALLASSMADIDPVYNTVEAQLLAALLFVSVFVILMPTAFVYTIEDLDKDNGATLAMSRASALIVLLIYVIYFAHEIRSRKANEASIVSRTSDVETGRSMISETSSHQVPLLDRQSTSGSQTLPPRTIRFADEDDGASETEGNDNYLPHRGRSGEDTIYQPLSRPRRHSRSLSLSSNREYQSRDSSISREGRPGLTTPFQLLRDTRADMDHLVHSQKQRGTPGNLMASVVMLVITSGLMSMCAEFLVSTIDDVTHAGHLSESIIGLIILPIVGNIAEYVTVVRVAVRDKLDLAIAVAVGSAIQIALCVAPLSVMAGWALQRDLALTFNFFEMATLVGAVLLVNLLILNEGNSSLRTSGLKGALMCACYVIFGLGAYLSP